ncbi:hypothetical protein GBA52_021768 [Prunus armeniaca]|nr:hypothetical protein GBA52_021768 [Prunus armeniaca]
MTPFDHCALMEQWHLCEKAQTPAPNSFKEALHGAPAIVTSADIYCVWRLKNYQTDHKYQTES